jgi:hypothetical protein
MPEESEIEIPQAFEAEDFGSAFTLNSASKRKDFAPSLSNGKAHNHASQNLIMKGFAKRA